MAIQIKLKNSVVQDSTPSTSDLPAVGEIALNANINSIGGFMRASDNTIVKIFGPGSLSTPTATTTVSGISELATNSETTAGSATNRVVTPAGLNAVTVAERTTSNTNYVAKAGSTLTGVLTMPNGSNSAPAINFGDSDSGIFGGTNTVSLTAGGTTRLTADTGVSVVGTLAVTGAITSTSDLTIADKIIHSGDTDTAIRFPAGNTVSVETGGSEAIRVDSSQRLLLGTSSARAVGGESNPRLQIEGTDANSWVNITRFAANNGSAAIQFAKSRSDTPGTYTIVQDDDILGQISFLGADGTDMANYAALIRAQVDGTPGANDMPGRLVFSTTADGGTFPTERLRIDSSGKIGINESSPLAKFHVKVADSGASAYAHCAAVFEDSDHTFIDIMSGTTGSGGINFGDSDGSQRGVVEYDHNSDFMRFIVAGGESLRLDSQGRLLVGTSSARTNLKNHNGNATTPEFQFETANVDNSNDLSLIFGRNNSFASEILLGKHRGATVGSNTIVQSGDRLGGITFSGSDGTNFIPAAYIEGSVDGTPGTDDMPGKLQFFTTADGASTPTTRMTINSSGFVGINQASPTCQLQIDGGSSGDGTVTILELNHKGNDLNDAAKLNFARAGGDIGSISLEKVNNNNTTDFIFNTRLSNTVSESMRITGAGNVGIGEDSPAANLHVREGDSGATPDSNRDTLFIENNGNSGLTIGTPPTNSGYLAFADPQNNNAGQIIYRHNTDDMGFFTAGTESLHIDSDGRVGIGTTDPTVTLDIESNVPIIKFTDANATGTPECEVSGAGGDITLSADKDNEKDSTKIVFQTDGTTRMSLSSTNLNMNSAYIDFSGSVSTPSTAAAIYRPADNTIAFSTANTHRMTINQTGIGIGTESPDSILDISSGTPLITFNSTVTSLGSDNLIGGMKVFKSDASGSGTGICGSLIWRSDDSVGARTYIQFTNRQNSNNQTNTDSECMRIGGGGATGNVNIGTSTVLNLGANNVTGINLLSTGRLIACSTGNASQFGRQGSSGKVIQFACQGTNDVGSIQVTTSSTVLISGSSDRRTKKNFEDWTEDTLSLFKNLKPQKFNFKIEDDGAEKTKGYIAQDLVDSFPEAYPKNEDDGRYMFAPQGMIVYLMKAIQELEAKVAALEAA